MNLTRCFFDDRKSRTCASSSSVMSNGSGTPRNRPPMYIMFEVSTHEILPSYWSSNKTPNESSPLTSTWSVFTSGAMNPQSSGTKYCWPSTTPDSMSLGLSWL